MKNVFLLLLIFSQISAFAQTSTQDLSVPIIAQNTAWNGEFIKIPAVAQYGDGDWRGVIGVSHQISLEQAFEIAARDPVITFFFYTNADQMILGNPQSGYRIFHRGDAVFFTGRPQWSDAGELADGYLKN